MSFSIQDADRLAPRDGNLAPSAIYPDLMKWYEKQSVAVQSSFQSTRLVDELYAWYDGQHMTKKPPPASQTIRSFADTLIKTFQFVQAFSPVPRHKWMYRFQVVEKDSFAFQFAADGTQLMKSTQIRLRSPVTSWSKSVDGILQYFEAVPPKSSKNVVSLVLKAPANHVLAAYENIGSFLLAYRVAVEELGGPSAGKVSAACHEVWETILQLSDQQELVVGPVQSVVCDVLAVDGPKTRFMLRVIDRLDQSSAITNLPVASSEDVYAAVRDWVKTLKPNTEIEDSKVARLLNSEFSSFQRGDLYRALDRLKNEDAVTSEFGSYFVSEKH